VQDRPSREREVLTPEQLVDAAAELVYDPSTLTDEERAAIEGFRGFLFGLREKHAFLGQGEVDSPTPVSPRSPDDGWRDPFLEP